MYLFLNVLDKLADYLTNRRFLSLLLLVGIVLFIISMWHRYPHIDDMWYGEQAYFLANDGIVKLETMDGILNFSERMFVYHKFHVILGAVLVKIFGWTVYPFKFLTLIFYIFVFYILYQYHKQNKEQYSGSLCILSCSLIFFNPNAFLYGFMYRPDILVMLLGFLTYFFLDKYLKSEKIEYIIFSGASAGLAFFTHLNGVVFLIAGFLVLVFFKKYKVLPVYMLTCTLFASLYFYDLWQEGHWEAMVYEFKNYPILKFGSRQLSGFQGFLMARISAFINEYKRFFWSYYVYPFSVIFFIAYLLNLKYLFQNFKSLFIYSTLIIIGTSILVSTKAQHYLLYYYPYMAIITAIGIYRSILFRRRYLMVLYIAGFSLQLYHFCFEFNKILNRNEDFVAKHERILSHIPNPAERVLVPYEYIFNNLPNYNLINFSGISYYQSDLGHELTEDEFFKRTLDLNVKYILLDKDFYKNEQSWLPDKLTDPNDLYKVIVEKDEFYLLEAVNK